MATVTIVTSPIMTDIKQHLAVIGKRAQDKEGNNIFSNITMSTAEESIISQYVEAAAQDIAAVASQFVGTCTTQTGEITMTVEHPRWDNISNAFVQAVKTYCILYSVGEYLAMTHTDLAKKYYDDAQQRIATITSLLYHKSPAS